MKDRAYYPALDGLRAVAVIAVFLTHYKTETFGVYGWMGVDVFFVLSGFLITGILFDSRDRVHRVRDFYMRRVLRIFPLYYAVWIGLFAVGLFVHWDWDWRWFMWPLHVGNYARFVFLDPARPYRMDVLFQRFNHNATPAYMGHFWSLCVEEQFYLVWPAIVFSRLDRRGLLRACGFGAVAVLLLRCVLYKAAPSSWIQAQFLLRFTWTRVDSFLIGGGLALCLRGPQGAWLEAHWRKLVWPAHIVFALCVAAWLRTHGAALTVFVDRYVSTIGLTVIDVWAAALILHAVQPGSAAYRLLQLRPLRALGVISYGFYVYHDLPHGMYAWFVAKHLGGRHMLSLSFCSTLVLSVLSYYLLEQPFLRLKRRFADQTHRAVPAQAEPA